MKQIRYLFIALLCLAVQGAWAQTGITDVMLIGSNGNDIGSLKTQYTEAGWTLIDYDLNKGCGSSSDYIYLLYKTGTSGHITGLYLKTGSERADNITANGHTYTIVPYDGADNFKNNKGDLNSNTAGEDINLYYTKDTFSPTRYITDISFSDEENGGLDADGDGKPHDLNKGCGASSAYIYLHLTYGATDATISVTTEADLVDAMRYSKASVQMGDNIALSDYLGIPSDHTITLDLNGHTLSRDLNEYDNDGHVIWVKEGGTLTVKDSSGNNSGKLSGGYSRNGAGICNYGTLTFEGGTISDCKVIGNGGAIRNRNNGTVTISGGMFKNCSADDDGGAFYNDDGCTFYFKDGTIKNCTAGGSGGGIYTAGGTLDISGGTITKNDASDFGDGVYFDGGTFYLEGNPVIKDNEDDNVYLNGSSAKIQIGGALTDGASIGLSTSDYNRLVSSGFRLNNSDAVPSDYFTADVSGVELTYEDDEIKLSGTVTYYVERSWSGGNTTGKVVSDVVYMSGYSKLSSSDETLSSGWYLLSGSVSLSKRLKINGNVRFILEDGCEFTSKKGIYIVKDKTLTIYGQKNDSGKLKITDGDDQTAIGGQEDIVGGKLVIHGGYIYAHSNDNNYAGIGGGNHDSGMQSVTIYGGEVDAHGESSAAGIGGGQQNNRDDQPVVKIYGGKVTCDSEDYAAGIGGGEDRGGCEVYIWGGTITATGGSKGAGIGGGQEGGGNKFVMYGGTVTATGGKDGAGVGGGHKRTGGEVYIYGGTLTAKGKDGAYAIGSGDDANGNTLTLTLGDNVCVKDANGNLVSYSSRSSTIKSATSCTVMTCTHSGNSATKKDDYYHHYSCSYCKGEDEAHTRGDDGKCTVCGADLPTHTWTFYESNSAGTAYQSQGTEYSVQEESEFTFPDCGTVPENMVFAGWERRTEAPTELTVDDRTGLVQPGETETVDAGDRKYYARYMETSFSGSGTEADPFRISTTENLDEISTMISKGDDLSGYYILLTDDIAYDKDTENNFTPIGTAATNFNGTFDGQGYTISGLNLSSSNTYQAIFGIIGEDGVVKGVTLDNSTITGGDNSGGISGKNLGTIENCTVTSNVELKTNKSNTNIGSFAGYNSGKISGCISSASVGSSKSKKSGGIAGYTTGAIEYCLYLGGSINGSNYVGSIAGNKGTAATFTKSYYKPVDGQPAGVGSNKQNDDKDGAEAGYTITSGTDGATLDFGELETSFNQTKIEVYAGGLRYDGALWTGGESSVDFTVSAGDDQNIAEVTTDNGTLTSNDDGSYTIKMATANAVVTVITEEMLTITLTDGESNAETLDANDGNTVNVDYDRDLSAEGSSSSAPRKRAAAPGYEGIESVAYTVCLPYDYDVNDHAYTESFDDDADAVARVFTLAAVDKDNKQFIFTDANSFIPAGASVVVVVYKGVINLGAKAVRINTTLPAPGQFVYPSFDDYLAHGKNYLGYWKGNFETMRAFYEAIESTDPGTYVPMYQPLSGVLQPFPADRFADPFANGGTPTGIRDINAADTVSGDAWYSLDGRRISGTPSTKGVYIHNGRKTVVK